MDEKLEAFDKMMGNALDKLNSLIDNVGGGMNTREMYLDKQLDEMMEELNGRIDDYTETTEDSERTQVSEKPEKQVWELQL